VVEAVSFPGKVERVSSTVEREDAAEARREGTSIIP